MSVRNTIITKSISHVKTLAMISETSVFVEAYSDGSPSLMSHPFCNTDGWRKQREFGAGNIVVNLLLCHVMLLHKMITDIYCT